MDDPDARENYTWTDFSKDLSLQTHLSHRECVEMAIHLENGKIIHPYDALVPVGRMVEALISIPPGKFGTATFALNLIKFSEESWSG